jgi:hypothetical protein
MVQPRKNLPLGAEALLGEAAAYVGAHQLDGDLGFVLIVVTHRAKDIAHAARAEHADDAVRADALADAAAGGARGREGLGTKLCVMVSRNSPGCSWASSSDRTSARSSGRVPASSARKADRSSRGQFQRRRKE